ncbi:MAG: hypothetical protein WCV92_05460 [Candidatus Buchananbacteria bacterium]
MGELIKLNFGKRRKEEEKRDEPETPKIEIEAIKELPTKEKEAAPEDIEASFEVAGVGPLFLSPAAYSKIINFKVSASTLKVQREIVSKFSNDELRGWIENSVESDWTKKPAFFRAIVDELRGRDFTGK